MATFFNWFMSKLDKKLKYSKITFQRTLSDDFIYMNNSLAIHAQKHPEVLSILNWKPEDMIYLSLNTLKREYLKAINLLIKKQTSYKIGRNLFRYEIEISYLNNEWLIVLEHEHRNLGSKNRPVMIPLKNPIIITCYPKKRIQGYTFNKTIWFLEEYKRISLILFDECEEFLLEKFDIWEVNTNYEFWEWKNEISIILEETLQCFLDNIFDSYEFPFIYEYKNEYIFHNSFESKW